MAVRVLSVALMVCVAPSGVAGAYYGKPIGAVKTIEHSFSGTVYAASESSVVITDLVYDGKGPAAYFWAGKGLEKLDSQGDQLPDEHGSTKILKAYKKAQVYLRLPRKITEYRTLGIYCKKFETGFGYVKIPADYVLPAEQSLGKLNGSDPGTMAAEVVLRDSAIMLLKAFQHDAQCPSATFVAALNAQPKLEELTHLTYNGHEKGKLPRFEKTDVTVQLPEGHHWNEFSWFSVYCIDTKQSSADVTIDKALAETLPLHNPESPVTTPAPNSGLVIRPLPVLTVLGPAAVAAAVAVRWLLDGVQRTKCS